MLSHNYDYRSNLEASERVNWKIEDVIDGRTFDFGRPFLPESLAGVNGIRCLNAGEKLKLNQIRGFTLPVSLRPGRGVHPAVGDRARRRQRARR